MIEYILALTGALFILLYVAFSIPEKEHTALKVLLISITLFSLFLFPRGFNSDCENLVNSTTVAGNTTSYTYTYVCEDKQDSQEVIGFSKLSYWVTRIFIIYLFLYITYHIWMKTIIDGVVNRFWGKLR